MKKLNLLLLLLPAVLAVGCSKDDADGSAGSSSSAAVVAAPTEDSAEATMQYLMDGMKAGQPVVVWNSLPENYQSDINGLVQTFGTNMDPETWKQSIGLLSTVHKLLVDKQDFILNYPALATSENADAMKKAIPQIAGFLKTIIDGSSDLESLKTFDGATFLSTTGANLVSQFDAIVSLVPNPTGAVNGLAAIDSVKIETIESTDSTATLKITGTDSKDDEQKFVKVNGKWLPENMTKDWDKNVQSAREALAQMPEKTGEMKMQVMMASGMVGGMLAPLQSAENQEQFNAALDGLAQSAMGMMMGGMGGGAPASFGAPAEDAPSDSGSQFGN
ncbi:MAG: hypothetical protein WAO83_09455 [Fuerstiella sp.]